jgi:hypothetical protein
MVSDMDTLADREPRGLAADLDDLPIRYEAARRCLFGAWIKTLSHDEQAAVWRAVRSAKPYRLVADAITRNGYPVSGTTINNHRVGNCNSCRADS